MKVISENNATDLNIQFLQDDEDYLPLPSFVGGHMTGTDMSVATMPPENILNDHPGKVARAAHNKVLLSIEMGEISSSVALFNTNAQKVIVEIIDATDGSITHSFGHTLKGASTYEELITNQNHIDISELMVTYPYVGYQHIVNIHLYHSTDNIDVGVVFVGMHSDFGNPDKGAVQSFKDYSIVSELASGATYTLQRSMVRTFDFSLDMTEACENPRRLKEVFMRIGPNPVPWLISDTDEKMWLVFARKETEPTGSFYAFNRVKAKARLIEVL